MAKDKDGSPGRYVLWHDYGDSCFIVTAQDLCVLWNGATWHRWEMKLEDNVEKVSEEWARKRWADAFETRDRWSEIFSALPARRGDATSPPVA